MEAGVGLDKLLRETPGLWRGRVPRQGEGTAIPTGHESLDQCLPGGGWPVGALTELIVPHGGIGELRLLMPALAASTGAGRWSSWIAPPYRPYAPALVQAGVDLNHLLVVETGGSAKNLFWSLEKLLQYPGSGMVLAWPGSGAGTDLRRLQLAAEAGGSLGFLFYRQSSGNTHAALRLQLRPMDGALEVEVLKARGGWLRRSVVVSV